MYVPERGLRNAAESEVDNWTGCGKFTSSARKYAEKNSIGAML
jgi:hypothetical protein